jgi:hypothetical protein
MLLPKQYLIKRRFFSKRLSFYTLKKTYNFFTWLQVYYICIIFDKSEAHETGETLNHV